MGEVDAAVAVEPLLQECARKLTDRAGRRSWARLEAEVLLAHVAGITRASLLIQDDVTGTVARLVRALVDERVATARPVAYLVGHRAFRDFDLEVDERVLVPRPETELIVDTFEQLLRAGEVPGGPVVDRGTGCGNLALSVCPSRPALAVDLSGAALEVAASNAARHPRGHGLLLIHGDGLAAVLPSSVAAVVANPPYVEAADVEALPPDVRRHEPESALLAGEGGADAVFAALLDESWQALCSGGWLITEVGRGQAPGVAERCRRRGFRDVGVRRDLADIERVVLARRP